MEGPVLLEPVRLTVVIRFIDSFRALNFCCTVRYLTAWYIRGSEVAERPSKIWLYALQKSRLRYFNLIAPII